MSATFTLEALGTMDNVSLYPKWDYKHMRQMDRNDHRTYSTNLFTYRWVCVDKIEMSLDWLAAADAALIRSWFENQNRVILTIDRDGSPPMQLFKLDAQVTPFKMMFNPGYYQGKISLHTINRSSVQLYHLVTQDGDFIQTGDGYYIGCIV